MSLAPAATASRRIVWIASRACGSPTSGGPRRSGDAALLRTPVRLAVATAGAGDTRCWCGRRRGHDAFWRRRRGARLGFRNDRFTVCAARCAACFASTCFCATSSFCNCAGVIRPFSTRISPSRWRPPLRAWACIASFSCAAEISLVWTAMRPSRVSLDSAMAGCRIGRRLAGIEPGTISPAGGSASRRPAVNPPSTTSAWPVTKEASSEHRKRAQAATSSGWPGPLQHVEVDELLEDRFEARRLQHRGHRRLDEAGAETVHAHAEGPVVDRHVAREQHDAALRRVVRRLRSACPRAPRCWRGSRCCRTAAPSSPRTTCFDTR